MLHSNGTTLLAFVVFATTAASGCEDFEPPSFRDAGADADEHALRDAGRDASSGDASPSQACDPGEVEGYYCCNLDQVSDPECVDGMWRCASGWSLTNDDPCEKVAPIPGDDAGA